MHKHLMVVHVSMQKTVVRFLCEDPGYESLDNYEMETWSYSEIADEVIHLAKLHDATVILWPGDDISKLFRKSLLNRGLDPLSIA